MSLIDSDRSSGVDRRRFIKLFGMLGPASLSVIALGCQAPQPTPSPAAPAAAPSPAASAPAPSPAVAKAAPTAVAPAKTAPPAKPAQITKWRAEIPTPKLDINAYQTWPIRKGWYAEYGLDVELVRLADPTAVKALVAGELESFDSALGPVLQAIEQGAEVKAVATFHPLHPFVLIGKKGISSLEDLVGKTVAISEQGSITETWILALLFKRGIDAQKMNWAAIGQGGTAAQLQALLAGKVDAATIVVGQLPAAERSGQIQVIAKTWQELPDLMRTTVCVTDKMLRDNPDRVVSFLAGYSKGIRYGLDRKEETVDLMTELTGSPREDMEYAWNWFTDNKALEPNALLRPEQIEYYQDLYVRTGLLKQKIPQSRVADLTIVPKVLAKIGSYQPGKTS